MILSNHATPCASDANELESAVTGIVDSVGKASSVLADTGYVNTEAFERLEAQSIDLYVSVSRVGNQERRYDYRPKSVTDRPSKVVKDPRRLAMQEKLKSEKGRKLYARRKQTVEPVFGIIKHVMGFRQFLLRGLEKVSGEWDLVCRVRDTCGGTRERRPTVIPSRRPALPATGTGDIQTARYRWNKGEESCRNTLTDGWPISLEVGDSNDGSPSGIRKPESRDMRRPPNSSCTLVCLAYNVKRLWALQTA